MITQFNNSDILSTKDKQEISKIIYAAFSLKFGAVKKKLPAEKWPEILKNILTFNKGLFFKKNNSILGVCLLEAKGFPCFLIQKKARKELGFFASLLMQIFFEHPVKVEDTLKIEMIAVAPEARGMGIGTKLINSVFSTAETEHKKKVVLEVVDTNPKARKLYGALGFNVVKKVKTAPFTNSSGFKSFERMERIIS